MGVKTKVCVCIFFGVGIQIGEGNEKRERVMKRVCVSCQTDVHQYFRMFL